MRIPKTWVTVIVKEIMEELMKKDILNSAPKEKVTEIL